LSDDVMQSPNFITTVHVPWSAFVKSILLLQLPTPFNEV
jgi:hypothetical protein